MSVMILHTKHGDDVLDATDLQATSLAVLRSRLREGYHYENFDEGPREEWRTRAEDIDANNDGAAAYRFLDERGDFEYEGFTLETPRTIT